MSDLIVNVRQILKEIKGLLYLPVSTIPGELGWKMRRFFLKHSVSLGQNVMIDEYVRIDHPVKLAIGSDSFIGRGSFIQAAGGVQIGANVLIGPGVKIWSVDHQFASRDLLIRRQGHTYATVVIEDDVWIGVDSIILKGVTICKGSVVAAGSIITKNVAEFEVVAGVPAKIIGKR